MRVFCRQHNKGFFTPRQTPIKCESRGHVLGELDFHGTAKTPVEIQWQYCCNCEHFSPIDFGHEELQRCPVCTRRASMMYLCDRCFTVSFESNTPLERKNFTLTAEGAPLPSCPGCLQEASADLYEHICDELQTSFMTALTSCPVCRERLDVGPVFPSSVADYLRRTKTRNKAHVTFDYDTEQFVQVADGEFVLISNSSEGSPPILLPRAKRFASKRDFYELYQDYYHCTNVAVGEVHIIEPATVEATGNGWRFQSTGLLNVVADEPKTKAPTNMPAPREVPIQPKQVPATATKKTKSHVSLAKDTPELQKHPATNATDKEESSTTPCPNCGSLIEMRYAFCWKCGNPMGPDKGAFKKTSETDSPLRHIAFEDDEPTAQHEINHIQKSILSSVPSWRRSAG